jgi:hypothetical protein
MRLQAQPLDQAYTYNFTLDGGSIDTIVSGIQLPNGARITAVNIYTIIAPTSGGSAVISIGTITTPTLFYTGAYTAFAANQGVSVLVSMDSTLDVVTTISGAALTAGYFQVYIKYYYPQ